MDTTIALALKMAPLASHAEWNRDDPSSVNAAIPAIVNHARLNSSGGQLIVSVNTGSTEDVKEYIRLLLPRLEVEGEVLTSAFDALFDHTVIVYINARPDATE